MTAIPDDIYQELVDEFGDDADDVASRALRSEITRHRITTAIKHGVDPSAAVAEALGRDQAFLTRTEQLATEAQRPSDLDERVARWG